MNGPVPPGSGWPGDPATGATPVAQTAQDVRELAAEAGTMAELAARQSVCRACPRLVEWREQVASIKRKSSRDEDYWGRPVPGWGEERPRILIVGLAPAAHGGNRTGRIFTGDRSGDVLFASLHRCGLAATATSVRAGDGQRLIGTRMAAAVRCAPPVNKPSVTERDTCAPWLVAEFAFAAPGLDVIVCLGAFAWQAAWSTLRSAGYPVPRPRPPFGHGREVILHAPGRPDSPSPPAGPGAPSRGATPATQAGPTTTSRPGGPSPVAADNSKRKGGGAGGEEGPPRAGRGVRGEEGPPVAGADVLPQSGDVLAQSGDVLAQSGDVLAQSGHVLVIGCYHPSQQNTFTGRVTPAMLDDVFRRAASAAGLGG